MLFTSTLLPLFATLTTFFTLSTASSRPHHALGRRHIHPASQSRRRSLLLPHLARNKNKKLTRRSARGSRRSGGGATLQCDSETTFSICGASGDCTSMGSVADGTICLSGAIVALSSASTASTTVAAVAASETESSQVESATEEAATFTSSVEVASSTSVVEVASVKVKAVEKTSTYLPVFTKTSSTTPAYVAPTTTSSSETSTSSASASATSSASGSVHTGTASYFYQEGGTGACGSVHADSDKIVALASDMYDVDNHCGDSLTITNTANGKSVTAIVADRYTFLFTGLPCTIT
ncbi:hypothetical protein P7C70_g2803, partial [Phenoliferia sp. Uapishka_3]